MTPSIEVYPYTSCKRYNDPLINTEYSESPSIWRKLKNSSLTKKKKETKKEIIHEVHWR